MSMSTIGFVAHALRPSIPEKSQPELGNKDSPRTVTGNSYLIFTTKNYGDNEMHWFWMVLVCVLLLDTNLTNTKHQLDEIEKQIEKYEKKLEEIKALRSSLGLVGVTLNDLAYSRDAGQNSGDWTTTWPVSIFPSQGAATWWRSPIQEENLMYDEQDWFERDRGQNGTHPITGCGRLHMG